MCLPHGAKAPPTAKRKIGPRQNTANPNYILVPVEMIDEGAKGSSQMGFFSAFSVARVCKDCVDHCEPTRVPLSKRRTLRQGSASRLRV
jgi:hypothetical protein